MIKFLRAINPIVWFKAYKASQVLKKRLSVSDFAHKHRNLVVIVLDPETDELYMAYRDVQVLNVIKSGDGKKQHLVKSLMKASQFKSKIDSFLIEIIEWLKIPIKNEAMQHFLKWLDGATFAIGKRIKDEKVNKEFSQFINKEKEKINQA